MEKGRGKRGRARGRARQDAATRRPGDEAEVRIFFTLLPNFGTHSLIQGFTWAGF